MDFQLAQVNTHLDRQVYSACFKIIDKKMHALNLDQVGERERDILRQREREREREKKKKERGRCNYTSTMNIELSVVSQKSEKLASKDTCTISFQP